jgi:putative phosphoserine phosphatase/1-acylglycerol-3-phosphate O-acyltransferase
MGTAFWIALPSALLNRDRTQFLNTCISVSGELGAAVAGLNLRVQGEEHLWSARPAVFIFNHQSAIDGVLVAKLLRRDFVAVAKQELRRVPVLGALAGLAGTVFLDRSNPEQAVAALQPAVDALRAGTSLVIAPEGTRSPTPRLGPFKKGAFRVAMQAGVPIVPIVFRNTLDAMPKHALVVRPAAIEAVVLPPVSTEGWSLDTLNREIARVRRAYLEVLNQR